MSISYGHTISESFLKIQTEIVGTSVAEYLGSVCEILTLILSKRMFSIISVMSTICWYTSPMVLCWSTLTWSARAGVHLFFSKEHFIARCGQSIHIALPQIQVNRNKPSKTPNPTVQWVRQAHGWLALYPAPFWCQIFPPCLPEITDHRHCVCTC